MTEPVRIGLAAESAELTALAKPLGYRIFRGTFDHAADAATRRLPPKWFVQDASGALVFNAESSAEVKMFLTGRSAPR